MDTQLADALKRRFAFETWRGTNGLSRSLFVWRLAAESVKPPGWKLIQAKKIEIPGAPVQFRLLWQRGIERAGPLLQGDIYECASREAAQDTLFDLLAHMQTPEIERDSNRPVGDVVFNGVTKPWIAFARANLVIALRNAGKQIIPVTSAAKDLDSDLIVEPEGMEAADVSAVSPQIRLRDESPQKGAAVPLDLMEDDIAGAGVKIFSEGDVYLEKGRLVFKSETAGSRSICIVPLSGKPGQPPASARTLRFKVR